MCRSSEKGEPKKAFDSAVLGSGPGQSWSTFGPCGNMLEFLSLIAEPPQQDQAIAKQDQEVFPKLPGPFVF